MKSAQKKNRNKTPHRSSGEQDVPRRVSCLISYLSPFRIIEDDSVPTWNATLEQINKGKWDYVLLHKLVGAIDVGLTPPYHMVVTKDGALVLPPIPKLRSDQKAVEFFNQCFASLLIGGVYCEAMSTDGLDIGFILDWTYVRSTTSGQAVSNQFHEHIRQLQCAPLEAINLVNPRTEDLSTLIEAMKIGLTVLGKIKRLRGDLLLKGTTGIARREWSTALSNLWIVIEQLLSHLWEREVLEPAKKAGSTQARCDQLKDFRTWPASTRIETLCQKGIISLESLEKLSLARKARNDLSHDGKSPTEASAQAAYDGVNALMKAVLYEQEIPLFKIDLANHSISDPFAKREPVMVEPPEYWMSIPKLPGEAELEQSESNRLDEP